MDEEQAMKDVLQDALDELVSTRSSFARVGEVLSQLELFLAELYSQPHTDQEAAERLFVFTRLQDTFECNVPSRILQWMSSTAMTLKSLTSKAKPEDHERKSEITALSVHLVQALSIIQGVALTHKGSKRFLGRRFVLEILLDILLTSRHVPTPPETDRSEKPIISTSPTNRNGSGSPFNLNPALLHLTCVTMDTILCVLVDSPPALRLFEELHGLQAIVKILKRNGSTKQARIKCMEFFYVYLMDEDAVNAATSLEETTHDIETEALLNDSPSSSFSLNDRFRPSHRPSQSMSSTSSRDTSSSSIFSAASTASTTASSLPSVPNPPKPSACASDSGAETSTPVSALKFSGRFITPPSQRPQPRNLMMLKKDIEYIPQSPKKTQIAGLGVGTPRNATPIHVRSKLRGSEGVPMPETSETDDSSDPRRTVNAAPETPRAKGTPLSHKRGQSVQAGTPSMVSTPQMLPKTATPLNKHRRARSELDVLGSSSTPTAAGGRASSSGAVLPSVHDRKRSRMRTIEEKKELLGTMLGNVDTLVDGIRKQGIWGLG